MANNRELIRAVYRGYATKKQVKELINSLETSLEKSKEIDKDLGFEYKSLGKLNVLRVIQETKDEIDLIKKKYGVK